MSLENQANQKPVSAESEANPVADCIDVLRNSYSNIKVFSVVPMGVLMILYFFTFATLIDRGMFGVLAFEIITTVIFMLAIIKINSWPFTVLKWRYGSKHNYNEVLPYLQYADFAKSTGDIVAILQERKQGSVVT